MYPGRFLRISRRIYSKIHKDVKTGKMTDNYFGNPILSWEAGNQVIKDKISSGAPLMVSRIGHTELTVLRNYFEIQQLQTFNPIRKFIAETRFLDSQWSDDNKYAIHFSSGFFPATDANLYKFCEVYFEAIPAIDVLGVWYNYFEDRIVHKYCPNATLIPLQSIEPYYFHEPWSAILKDRKVLVIHPFEKSILRQYAIREKLFADSDVLPAFQIETIKSVQAVAHNKNPFPSWFDGLEYMKAEIANKSFDIALIGAGAYGLPLAAYIKSLGKQAIHVGGALQILFGIKGSRWDDIPAVSKFYNPHWTRPLPEETPEKYKEFEFGKGYW